MRAWRPPVPGVAEVFHAQFTEHVYPMHAHDTWTLLIVDDGAVRYDLDRHEHGALGRRRHAAAAGRPAQRPLGRPGNPDGFRKRVLYLERDSLGAELVGAAVDRPAFADPLLRQRIHQVHGALRAPGEELEAESRLTLVRERLRERSTPLAFAPPAEPPAGKAASLLRDLIDARVVEGVSVRGRRRRAALPSRAPDPQLHPRVRHGPAPISDVATRRPGPGPAAGRDAAGAGGDGVGVLGPVPPHPALQARRRASAPAGSRRRRPRSLSESRRAAAAGSSPGPPLAAKSRPAPARSRCLSRPVSSSSSHPCRECGTGPRRPRRRRQQNSDRARRRNRARGRSPAPSAAPRGR